MRIAISGTHRSGKSSLVEALRARLPKYVCVEEPYHALEEEGFEFSHPPALEDFEAQLEWSVERLGEEDESHALFDRCPADVLAYIAQHEDADAFDLEDWLPRVRAAVDTLDLIVFVPIESPDRIAFSRADDEPGSRSRVDEQLREILVEDSYGFGAAVLEVEGTLDQRLRAVLEHMQTGQA
jgi:thymidylate kinase